MANRTFQVADPFCGAGGSSTGAQRAIAEIGGAMELVAVNHWNTATATHIVEDCQGRRDVVLN